MTPPHGAPHVGQCHRGGPLGILNRGPAHGRGQLTLAGDGAPTHPPASSPTVTPITTPSHTRPLRALGLALCGHTFKLSPLLSPSFGRPFLSSPRLMAALQALHQCHLFQRPPDYLGRCPCPSGAVPPVVPAAGPFLVSPLCFGFCLGASPSSTVGSLMAGIKFVFCPKESMSVD